MFPEADAQYLKSQHSARIATLSSKGQPDVVHVGFELDGKYFWVESHSQDIFQPDAEISEGKERQQIRYTDD